MTCAHCHDLGNTRRKRVLNGNRHMQQSLNSPRLNWHWLAVQRRRRACMLPSPQARARPWPKRRARAWPPPAVGAARGSASFSPHFYTIFCLNASGVIVDSTPLSIVACRPVTLSRGGLKESFYADQGGATIFDCAQRAAPGAGRRRLGRRCASTGSQQLQQNAARLLCWGIRLLSPP